MNSVDGAIAVIDALEALQIPYMIVGALSVNVYGPPRDTIDADFVLELENTSVTAIAEKLGAGFEFDPQLTFERVTGTSRYMFRVVETGFKIELFLLSDDPHDQLRFSRRLRMPVEGRETWIPTVEDVIITKLRWARISGRGKDRQDIKGIIQLQGDSVDWDDVHAWAAKHGTCMLLDEIREELQP